MTNASAHRAAKRQMPADELHFAKPKALPSRIPQADLDEIEAMVRGRTDAVHVDPALVARFVENACHARQCRNSCFGADADLFGEPAWDILLELYRARVNHSQISVGTACLVSYAPSSTALRYVASLQERGLARREPHPSDRRSAVLRITEKGSAVIEEWYRQLNAR